MRYLPLLILVTLLNAGCASTQAVPVKLKPVINPDILQPCDEPSSIALNSSFHDVLIAHAKDVQTIKTCSFKHEGLKKVLEGLINE